MSCLPELSLLNPRQQEAVCWLQGHLLVLAGAGSGKTRVLVTRIMWLMATQQVPLQSLLVVTFTNKAARELVARTEQLLGCSLQTALIGTFHHICYRMLRIHATLAGLRPGFDIIDHGDQIALIKRILKEKNISTDLLSPHVLCQSIHKAKQSMRRAGYWDHREDDRLAQLARQVYEAYDQRCQEENVVDFTEILLRCYELLRDQPDLLIHYQHRLKHIMVDEFQDTNALQYAWLKLLASAGTNQLFVVGDDDQSIYSFRGADTSNMSLFIQDFAGDHVVRLEQNYRSRPMILDAANALIARNAERLGKKLWSEDSDTEPVSCIIATDDVMEARWVATTIMALRQEHPDWDMVILYRTNVQSRYFEQSLFAQGIPYQIFGGLRFLDRAEIKNAVAYLRLMMNAADNTAFLRIVNFPTRGIGEKTIARLIALAEQMGISYLEACGMMTGTKASVLKAFANQIAALGEAAQRLSLVDFFPIFLQNTGLQAFYAQEKDVLEKQAHFDQLLEVVVSYQHTLLDESTTASAWSVLDACLASLHLDGVELSASSVPTRVHLMTVHMAKGLEYDAVFVTGLEQGLFPNDKCLHDPAGLEEERRLMYVAMTRAKKALFLSYARRRHLYNQTFFSPASQFLSEIPARFLQMNDLGALVASPVHSGVGRSVAASQELGRAVHHERFGEGVVIAVQGQGENKQVTVRFDNGETKSLLLAWAPLTFLSH